MKNTIESPLVNGYNVTALNKLAVDLKEHSEAGNVTFKSTSKWQDGARVFTHFSGYSIDEELCHEEERKFVLLSDEPTELTGTDVAPGPVEQLLHALGSCIAATVNANAAMMGVSLSHLEVTLESAMDLHGYFGLDENVRPGIQLLTMNISIDGDADRETLKVIAQKGYYYSPVRDSINNEVNIKSKIIVSD